VSLAEPAIFDYFNNDTGLYPTLFAFLPRPLLPAVFPHLT
jgi:hypothetical protein